MKICDCGEGYSYSQRITSVVVDECTFADLSKKPGIDIDSKPGMVDIVIKNCDFYDVQIGDQGNFIYETDNVVPTLSGNVIGISKAETLKAISVAVNQKGQTFSGYTFKLGDDIDLQNEAWTPIGLDTGAAFAGVFDGQNKTISNLKVDQTSAHTTAGLFGAINGAAIKNLTLDGVEVASVVSCDPDGATVNGIGAVAGSAAYGGYISGVTVKNAVLKGNRYIGGIVGYSGGDVTGCSVEDLTITCTPDNLTGSYDNGDKAGGIIGYTNNPHNEGNITGNTVKNVSITAYRDLGGIVGAAYLGSYEVKGNIVEGTLNLTADQTTNSYGTKDANAGAIVGRILNGSLDSSNTANNAEVTIATK